MATFGTMCRPNAASVEAAAARSAKAAMKRLTDPSLELNNKKGR